MRRIPKVRKTSSVRPHARPVTSNRLPQLDRRDPTLRWLLDSTEPAIRAMALADLLDAGPGSKELTRAQSRIMQDPKVRTLLRGQRPNGGFGGGSPYQKWHGVHWRLVALVELGVPPGEKRSLAAANNELDWMTRRTRSPSCEKKARYWIVHASMDGNALATASRLGMAGDPRARMITERLIVWQRPDGGWNCDPRPGASHSSFHESLASAWGLSEYGKATGSTAARRAASEAVELFLTHRIFRSHRTGDIIRAEWLRPHYPPYWHYDLFQALLVVARCGRARDSRAAEALDIMERAMGDDGRWTPVKPYWRLASDPSNVPVEVVDWGRGRPSKLLTLNCMRILKAAGRLARR